jgi:GH24 family phage-related lysozyme (muramidase)
MLTLSIFVLSAYAHSLSSIDGVKGANNNNDSTSSANDINAFNFSTISTDNNHIIYVSCLQKNLKNFAINECTNSTNDNSQPSTTNNNNSKCLKPTSGTPIKKLSISNAGIRFIAKQEGFAKKLKNTCSENILKSCKITGDDYGLYQDAAGDKGAPGFCTEGFGHLVGGYKHPCTQKDIDDYHKQFPAGMSADDAEELLTNDLDSRVDTVNNNVDVQLTQNEEDALVSFEFNTGHLAGSTLLKDINSGNCDHANIAKDFGQWNKIKVNGILVENRGLTIRRADEAGLFNWGVYNVP